MLGTMNCLHNNQNMMNNLIRSELLWEPLQSMKTDVSVSVPNTGTSNSPISSPARNTSSVLRFSSSNSARRYSQDSTGSANSPMGNSRNSFGPSPTSQRMARAGSKKTVRKISRIPYKVLDAPALQDDYYLNLVDWSSTNFLSVALGNSVYLWSASNLKVVKLCELEAGDSVTAISWALKGNQLAVGTNTGKILIWDTVKREQIRELTAHTSRVGTLAWNSTVVASGSRDRNIYVHDIRMRGAEDSISSPSSSQRSSFIGMPGGAVRADMMFLFSSLLPLLPFSLQFPSFLHSSFYISLSLSLPASPFPLSSLSPLLFLLPLAFLRRLPSSVPPFSLSPLPLPLYICLLFATTTLLLVVL
jgi:Anaphase-promoting complex subunit 4 WD40 domain